MTNVPGFWFEPSFILRLRQALQRPKSEDGLWAWYFGRRFSIYLTLLFSKTPVTPNQITVGSIIVGVAGGMLWTLGAHWSFLLGAVLLQLMFILDCVDGEVARIKNLKSPMGAYLDFLGHYLMDYCMIMGLGIGLSHIFGAAMIYVALAFAAVFLGDELLRDVLLKARVSSGQSEDLEAVHRLFSLYESSGSTVRAVGGMLVGSPALYNWTFLFSLLDLLLGIHYLKLAFYLLWGFANLLRFAVRFRRILRSAFPSEAGI